MYSRITVKQINLSVFSGYIHRDADGYSRRLRFLCWTDNPCRDIVVFLLWYRMQEEKSAHESSATVEGTSIVIYVLVANFDVIMHYFKLNFMVILDNNT